MAKLTQKQIEDSLTVAKKFNQLYGREIYYNKNTGKLEPVTKDTNPNSLV